MITRFFWRQSSKPSGWFGRFWGNIRMVRDNGYAAKWTVALLNIQPESRVLEVGFGSGVGIRYASEQANQGFVSGIDHSKEMVQSARQRNAAAVKAGRVELKHGDVSTLPYSDESFDMAFAIQSIFFWREPVDCLIELRRVLKTGGALAITLKPKDKMNKGLPPEFGTLYDSEQVVSMLTVAGFRNVRVEHCPKPDKYPGDCIIGVKNL